MREKDNHITPEKEQEKNAGKPKSLSDSIADAHAAGDGALERGKDSLIASDDDSAPGAAKPGEGEAY